MVCDRQLRYLFLCPVMKTLRPRNENNSLKSKRAGVWGQQEVGFFQPGACFPSPTTWSPVPSSLKTSKTSTFQLFWLPAGGSKNTLTTTKAPTTLMGAVVAPWQFWNTSWLNISWKSILKTISLGQQDSSTSNVCCRWPELDPQSLHGGRKEPTSSEKQRC